MGNLLPDTLVLLASGCAFALVAGGAFVALRAYEAFRQEWLSEGGGAAAAGLRESMLLGLLRKAVLVPVSPVNARFVPKRFYAPVSTLLIRGHRKREEAWRSGANCRHGTPTRPQARTHGTPAACRRRWSYDR